MVAPADGALEWRVEVGAVVEAGSVLAWLNVKDHCAVLPVVAPRAGVLRWRRSAELPQVEAGEPLASCSGEAASLAELSAAERRAAVRARQALTEERARLLIAARTLLGAQLVSRELRALEHRLERVERLCAGSEPLLGLAP